MEDIQKIDSISTFHGLLQLSPPKHPLISVIDLSKLNDMEQPAEHTGMKVASSFYAITLKHLKTGSIKYGRKQLDFQEGSLFFSFPDQVGILQNPVFEECSYNWGLFFHAELLYGTRIISAVYLRKKWA